MAAPPAAFELASAQLGCALRRLGSAHPRAALAAPNPSARARALTLYEYEPSPYCKRVREATCALGLSVSVVPCARTTLLREGDSGTAGRAEARALLPASEALRFPLLHDAPATAGAGDAIVLVESRALVVHLWRQFGDGAPSSKQAGEGGPGTASALAWAARTAARAEAIRPYVPGGSTTRLRNLVSMLADEDLPGLFLAAVPRPFGRAGLAHAQTRAVAAAPAARRELWAREGCARGRLLREALCSLGLRYTLHGMGGAAGSALAADRLAALRVAHGGAAEPPFLVDEGAMLAGSGARDGWAALVDGLWSHYALHAARRPTVWDLFRR